MVDVNLQASTRRMIYRAGLPVQFQRVTGFAPNTTTLTVSVKAVVRGMAPDPTAERESGYASGKIGTINQDEREFIVMADDLSSQGFTLPLQKNDKIIVQVSGEKLNISAVDASKRYVAGAIEGRAVGV